MQEHMRLGSVDESLFHVGWRSVMIAPRTYYYSSGLYAYNRSAYFAYPDLYAHTCRVYADSKQHNLYGLAHYRTNLLAITGDQDTIVPPQQAHQIAQCVPHSKLVTIPNCGHMAMTEQASIYNATINEWLVQYAS